MQCGAKTRSGAPCKTPAMANGKCRMHGGSSPVGIAHPRTTHGRHSAHLPTRLAERYITSQADPDLLNLQSEINLVDTRITELLERIDIDGAGALWERVAWLYGDMQQAVDESLDDLPALVDKLGEIVRRAKADQQAWDAIHPVVEQRRRLVESEQKRRVAMQDMVTSEQAMLLVSALLSAVNRHVNDPLVRGAIASEFGALTTRDDPATA